MGSFADGSFVKGLVNPLTGGVLGSSAEDEAKKKKKSSRSAAKEKKRADDLTNAFGRTLLNDPLGNSGSLLQGRPGGVGGGTLLG